MKKLNSVYRILFCRENIDRYKKIAELYVSYWSKLDPCVNAYENYCIVCSLSNNLVGKNLYNFYYSCTPFTRETIIDPAIVIIFSSSISKGQSEDNDAAELQNYIQNVHPYSIAYHLFFNCCFVKKKEECINGRTLSDSSVLSALTITTEK